MNSPFPLVVSLPDELLLAPLQAKVSNVDFVVWDLLSSPPRDVIDIVVPPYMSTNRDFGLLSSVRTQLVQSQSIGYDGVKQELPPGITFANAKGVHETSTAELAVALILASKRGIPGFVRDAEESTWRPRVFSSLADSSVLLVGYGGVGKAIEERLLPFEVTITRIASKERHDERGIIHSIDALNELLPLADIIVVSVPLGDDTKYLINRDFLSRVRSGALVVNMARGLVGDTQSILDEATSQRLRFALDVVDPEPLPNGHPLFALDNVLISPHVGGATSAMFPRMVHLLSEQISRLQNSQTPLNVVLRT